MLKIILTIGIVFLISLYLNFGINMWQTLTEDMEEIDDGGPIFYPEYIVVNPFEVLDKHNV